MFHRVRSAQVLNELRRQYRRREAIRNNQEENRQRPPVEAGINPDVYAHPTHEDWKEAWQVTEQLLVMMRDEVGAREIPFVIITTTSPSQVHPDVQVQEQWMLDDKLSTPFYPEERLAAFARDQHIPFMSLAQPLSAVAQKKQVYLHGFPKGALGYGHWNADGHREAGVRIADFLCGLLTKDS